MELIFWVSFSRLLRSCPILISTDRHTNGRTLPVRFKILLGQRIYVNVRILDEYVDMLHTKRHTQYTTPNYFRKLIELRYFKHIKCTYFMCLNLHSGRTILWNKYGSNATSFNRLRPRTKIFICAKFYHYTAK